MVVLPCDEGREGEPDLSFSLFVSKLLRLRRRYLLADSEVPFVTAISSLEVRINWGTAPGGDKRLSTDEAGEGAFCKEPVESSRWGERRYLLGDDFGVASNDVKDKSGMLDERLMNASLPGLRGGDLVVVAPPEDVVEVDEVLR